MATKSTKGNAKAQDLEKTLAWVKGKAQRESKPAVEKRMTMYSNRISRWKKVAATADNAKTKTRAQRIAELAAKKLAAVRQALRGKQQQKAA